MMSKCDTCHHRHLCKIRAQFGEIVENCAMFEDVQSILPMIVPLGTALWVIDHDDVWKGTLEKVSISKEGGIWLEVKMPTEMPDVVSIEFRPSDFGETVFRSEEAARKALLNAKLNNFSHELHQWNQSG